jgi:hypothetical protein
MPTTPNYALPYPVATDTADVPRDIQALATRLDDRTVIPRAVIAGQVAANGTITKGTGFTVNKTGTGNYVVTITAGGILQGASATGLGTAIQISAFTNTTFNLALYSFSGGAFAFADQPWSFVAYCA